MRFVFVYVALLVCGSTQVFAQTTEPKPVGGASADVRVEGQGAVRAGDGDGGRIVQEGSSNVFINGKPAARLGDSDGCGGKILMGSTNVFVNGRPLARVGDPKSGCR